MKRTKDTHVTIHTLEHPLTRLLPCQYQNTFYYPMQGVYGQIGQSDKTVEYLTLSSFKIATLVSSQ